MSRCRWDSIPDHLQSRVVMQSSGKVDVLPLVDASVQIPAEKHGVKMNKTEAAYYEILKREEEGSIILSQSVKLRLADNTWYTPDFLVFHRDGCDLAIEVKGGLIRDDAMVKFKIAREMYPIFRWKMMQKCKGEWREIRK